MASAYIYQAALYCEACGKALRAKLAKHAAAEDSDTFPQGPYSDGGGEADTPQHCDGCGAFLENPLTQYGAEYVRYAVREYLDSDRGNRATLTEWTEFYDWLGLSVIDPAEA